MKATTLRVLTLLLLLAAPFTAACRVRQTEEGEMPKVKVETEKGKLPEYDVDTAEVEVKKKQVTVTVPDVDIKMPPEGTTEPPPPQNQ
jgi:hypothetical protein